MAKKIVQQVTYVDDLSGEELSETDVNTVRFGWDGSQFEIDLSNARAEKLEKFLQPYIEAARKTSSQRGRPRSSGSSQSGRRGSGHSKETLAQIREWARANGHDVSPRGRIAAPILEAWEQAHKS